MKNNYDTTEINGLYINKIAVQSVQGIQEFDKIKYQINKRALEINMCLSGMKVRNIAIKAMHFINIEDTPYFLTCYVDNDRIRFGVYDTVNKTLYRNLNNLLIFTKVSSNNWEHLIRRLENSFTYQLNNMKPMNLQPLNDLWEKSIEREKIDNLPDIKYLNINIDDLTKEDNFLIDEPELVK